MLEGDDYWHDCNKLTRQVELLNNRPDMGMVHSNYNVYHQASGYLQADYVSHRQFKVPADPDFATVLTECRESFRIQTCTVMLRRQLVAEIMNADPSLYRNSTWPMGDTQLWIEIAARARIGFLPEPLATYRLLEESASRTRDLARAFRFEAADNEMRRYLCTKYSVSEEIRRKVDLMWCRNALRQAFHEGNVSLAAEACLLKRNLSIREHLLVLGARSRAVRSLLLLASGIRRTLGASVSSSQ
jgi:hypothetical protein